MNEYKIKFKDEQHTILSPKSIEEVVYAIQEMSKTNEFLMLECVYQDITLDECGNQDTTYKIFIKPSEIYYIS